MIDLLQKSLRPILPLSDSERLEVLEELTLLTIQFILLSFTVAIFVEITF